MGGGQEEELWEVKLNQTEMCNDLVGGVFLVSPRCHAGIRTKLMHLASFFYKKSVYVLE